MAGSSKEDDSAISMWGGGKGPKEGIVVGLAILAGVFFLILIAGIGAFALGAIWFALRAVFWVVLLPFRLLFLVLTLPLLLMFVLAAVGVAIVGGLILAAAGLIAALVVPLLPIALAVALVWALVRLSKRPVSA